MSTLVSLLFAIVVNIFSSGDLSHRSDLVSVNKIINCNNSLLDLNPHFIITEDEMSSINK
jgi:hypothetical protein